jgi:hypothetical protein
VYQAGRGDVDTVLVNGQVVKSGGKLVGIDLRAAKDAVGRTVDYAQTEMGEKSWDEGMHPELPPAQRIPNPYTYTSYEGSSEQHTAQTSS